VEDMSSSMKLSRSLDGMRLQSSRTRSEFIEDALKIARRAERSRT